MEIHHIIHHQRPHKVMVKELSSGIFGIKMELLGLGHPFQVPLKDLVRDILLVLDLLTGAKRLHQPLHTNVSVNNINNNDQHHHHVLHLPVTPMIRITTHSWDCRLRQQRKKLELLIENLLSSTILTKTKTLVPKRFSKLYQQHMPCCRTKTPEESMI